MKKIILLLTILSLGLSAIAQDSMLHLKSSTDAAGALQNEVGLKFTKWSDATSILRPSRWATPFKEGGFLSWLNPVAWKAAPARTGIILAGNVVIVTAAVVGVDAIADAISGDDNNGGGAPAQTADINAAPLSDGNGPSGDNNSPPGGGAAPGGGMAPVGGSPVP